jgi:hypothetical protein
VEDELRAVRVGFLGGTPRLLTSVRMVAQHRYRRLLGLGDCFPPQSRRILSRVTMLRVSTWMGKLRTVGRSQASPWLRRLLREIRKWAPLGVAFFQRDGTLVDKILKSGPLSTAWYCSAPHSGRFLEKEEGGLAHSGVDNKRSSFLPLGHTTWYD